MAKSRTAVSLIAIYWWITLNIYFGWNLAPQSGEELLADGLFLLMVATAFTQVDTP